MHCGKEGNSRVDGYVFLGEDFLVDVVSALEHVDLVYGSFYADGSRVYVFLELLCVIGCVAFT